MIKVRLVTALLRVPKYEKLDVVMLPNMSQPENE